ncbi:type II toxin-antitoxin system RelE/ParE family toxin [Flavobacterium sp. IMCC34518]|uniref:type II toxin-antitoxin system RelE/ParE family toxin n=1 Tax=Flavobacterium sp. IMCC34518 TaxID=3003623 RepID=UPI0024822FFC|nr:type II toxin-antitoxin system RelE/ParE family toxin [Flavobacterium sp. IMCC34518]
MREIKISINAQKKTNIILEYLEAKWSERVRIKFAKKLYDSLKIIRANPEIFPKSVTNKKFHKCVVTKQTTLFYTFTSERIYVVALFDTRQNPSKIKKIE